MDDLDPAGFGERLFPGHGEELAAAWKAMSIDVDDAAVPRNASTAVSSLAQQKDIALGDLEGLLFGSPHRYLNDLVLQLRLWADIVDLKACANDPDEAKSAFREVVSSLHAWNDRHGFRDRYHDVYYYSHAHPIYREALTTIGTPEAVAAVEKLDMFQGGSHGRLAVLMEAMDAAVSD